jgi:multidrug resistance efflux pump
MAKVKKLYWTGKGQVKVDGKLYGKGSDNGRAFPVDKVDSERLKQWKKNGLCSEKPFDDDETLTTIEQLEAKVKDLSVQLVEANKGSGDKKLEEKVAALEADNEEKAALIDQLKADLEEATKPADDTDGNTGS